MSGKASAGTRARRDPTGERGWGVTPTEYYVRSARRGFNAFLAVGVLVAATFLAPTPGGEPNWKLWARWLDRGGLPEEFAGMVLWAAGITFTGCCAMAAAWAYRRRVPARCPGCGQATYSRAEDRWAYRCSACGRLDQARLGGDEPF